MKFNDLITAKSIRFVAITIVLGAIGSGVWEWLLKPALASTSAFGLSIATLGMKTFKDSLYKEIALGFHEESSVRLYTTVFMFFPGFMLGLMTGILKAKRKSGDTPGIFSKITDKLLRPLIILFVFITVFSAIETNKIAYVNRAINHFEVLMKTVSPYIAEEQRLLYQSQFTQISSKEDYARLDRELMELCKTKKLKMTEFSIW